VGEEGGLLLHDGRRGRDYSYMVGGQGGATLMYWEDREGLMSYAGRRGWIIVTSWKEEGLLPHGGRIGRG
jgi:hypothetical protein